MGYERDIYNSYDIVADASVDDEFAPFLPTIVPAPQINMTVLGKGARRKVLEACHYSAVDGENEEFANNYRKIFLGKYRDWVLKRVYVNRDSICFSFESPRYKEDELIRIDIDLHDELSGTIFKFEIPYPTQGRLETTYVSIKGRCRVRILEIDGEKRRYIDFLFRPENPPFTYRVCITEMR